MGASERRRLLWAVFCVWILGILYNRPRSPLVRRGPGDRLHL